MAAIAFVFVLNVSSVAILLKLFPTKHAMEKGCRGYAFGLLLFFVCFGGGGQGGYTPDRSTWPEDMAWMFRFWGRSRNKYHLWQECRLPAGGSMCGGGGGTGHRGAHACAEGLENMLVHLLSQSAVASQYPLVSVGPHIVDYKLNVVTVAWNKVVARGGMSHGPLLCHANLMGNEIVVTHIGSTWFQMRVGTCGLHTHGAPMAKIV